MRGESRDLLYFAYGEHLNEEEMKRDFPGARMAGFARLKGFSLCFTGKDGSGRAALKPDAGASVPGRLWALREADAEALDRYFDDPFFARREVRMVQLDGMTLPALVYVPAPGQQHGRPGFVTYSIMREAYEAIGEDVDSFFQAAARCAP